MKNTEIDIRKKMLLLLLFLGYNSICIENMLNFYSHIEISSSFSDKLKELQSATDSSPTILYRLRFIERLLQCHGIGRTKRELKIIQFKIIQKKENHLEIKIYFRRL